MLEALLEVAVIVIGIPLVCLILHKIMMVCPIYKNFIKKVTEDFDND